MSARLRAAALAALCLSAAGSRAEDLFVLRSGLNEVVLIDRASIVRKGSRARAWVVERKEGGGGANTESRSLYVFDCAARTLGVAGREDGAGAAASLSPPRSGLEQTLIAYACGR
ncbi:MAG TPA: hypothetical protein VNM24_16800 [Burkholderiales bacterium]|jgi:hypothetical protein|nr:hypothetical protein [Burkholderiales bacterium]